jgi:hypothetical protein
VCEAAILEWRPFIRLSANAADAAPMSSSRLFVLIPCAGSGHRAGHAQSTLPKQYRRLAGAPMVAHTLDAFRALARGALPGWRWWCRRTTATWTRCCPLSR